MLIPHFLYGLTREVQTRVRKRLRVLAKGASWAEAMADQELDAAEVSDLLVLHGPAPLLGGHPHIHVYLPLLELEKVTGRKGPFDVSLQEPAFAAALETAWGTLGALGPANLGWVIDPAHHRPLVQASARFWEQLDGLGPRYTVGLPSGQSLWDCTPNVCYPLAQLGLPKERLRHLPPGGLPELAAQVL